jgi:protein-disulfide isomerase
MMRALLLLLPALMLSAQTTAVRKDTPPPVPGTYKQMGSPSAPITFEVYADYECPGCGEFFRNIVPDLVAQYVKTGKIRFSHRDLPLVTIHQHAQLAARYADAAGELGFYDLAVTQIYKTQDQWSQYGKNTGDIDGELAKVIPPGAMQKVRELVKADPRLDDSLKADYQMAINLDHVNGTPTVVLVSKGKREIVGNVTSLPLSVWKSYLDKKLSEQ